MRLTIPDFCLVVLVGPTGSGKSSFAARHFAPTEVLSSDACRAMVCDDENSLEATGDAFELLHYMAEKRLARRRLTVVDATSVKREDRRHLVALAKRHHALAVAIVLNMPEGLCHERNSTRPNRDFGRHVVRNHVQQLRRSLRGMRKEGFRYVHSFDSPAAVDAVEIERQPLWTDRRAEQGPFDIIGDIHGCFDELQAVLAALGYETETTQAPDATPQYRVSHPDGRRVIFVGDLVDRGPKAPEVLRLAMDMVESGCALCVPGNHEVKLLRKLHGRQVKVNHGLGATLEQLAGEPAAFSERVAEFIDGLVSHFLLDDGKLVVAHAGLPEAMQGRSSGAVRAHALYGETTGETDEFGLPIRYNWAADYRGRAMVVYGHTPVPEAEWLNNTICLDTGCVFGGKLSALRYPERELVQVPAARVYYEPLRPLQPEASAANGLGAQHALDELLELEDVRGKRIISTRLRHNITQREDQATAALEVMSRFAANPKWLIYLPPTMAPSETSERADLLEHPDEAFAYFEKSGAERVVCEEKHMGSRAVAIVCRDEAAARRRFGVTGGETGIVYSRTGRAFFNDPAVEAAVLGRLRTALGACGFWGRFESDWVCLDCEIMPWSAKAQALLREQYAPVATAAEIGLAEAVSALEQAARRGLALDGLLEAYRGRRSMAGDYRDAYRRYCWTVESIDDLKLAPFHLLASEGAVHADKDHLWHMTELEKLCRADESLLLATAHRTVALDDPSSRQAATEWWQTLTGAGGEGMVVKPLGFVLKDRRGLVQPALKCRGREYLRIIYGPEYTAPGNLTRLRKRAVGRKRSLAVREFALGIEALERFARREPLRRVHECVFAVLAMESEPVDPRL